MISTSVNQLILLQEKVIQKEKIKEQIDVCTEKTRSYENMLVCSREDVNKKLFSLNSLDKFSIKNLFLKLTGRMSDAKHKAKSDFDIANNQYNILLEEYEKVTLNHKLLLKEYRILGNCDINYKNLKCEFFTKVIDFPDIDENLKELVKKVIAIETELEKLQSEEECIESLIELSKKILVELDPIHKYAKADANSYDNIRGKFMYIDEINNDIEMFGHKLIKLKSYSPDVYSFYIPSTFKYDSLTRIIDTFFEGPTVNRIEHVILQDVKEMVFDIEKIYSNISECLPKHQNVMERKKSYLRTTELELYEKLQFLV